MMFAAREEEKAGKHMLLLILVNYDSYEWLESA
jgi:hypothetical protein